MQSVYFMICSLFAVKCFQETGLKNIVKKITWIYFFWGKKQISILLEGHFEKFLAPQLIPKVFAVSKYPCIYAILYSAHTLRLFIQCLFGGFFINFILLQNLHLFSFQLYFLWNLQVGPMLSWNKYSFAAMFVMVYLSTNIPESKIWSHGSSRGNIIMTITKGIQNISKFRVFAKWSDSLFI